MELVSTTVQTGKHVLCYMWTMVLSTAGVGGGGQIHPPAECVGCLCPCSSGGTLPVLLETVLSLWRTMTWFYYDFGLDLIFFFFLSNIIWSTLNYYQYYKRRRCALHASDQWFCLEFYSLASESAPQLFLCPPLRLTIQCYISVISSSWLDTELHTKIKLNQQLSHSVTPSHTCQDSLRFVTDAIPLPLASLSVNPEHNGAPWNIKLCLIY